LSHDALWVDANARMAVGVREPPPAVIVSPDDARTQRAQTPRAADIAVEIAADERLTELQADWDALLARADTANVFMNPSLVKLASDIDPRRRRLVLLAWRTRDGGRELVGIWAFAIGRAPQSALPIDVLTAPAMPHGYLATPVIDRKMLDATLEAMLTFVTNDDGLPNIIVLDGMTADGATMRALHRVLAARGSAPCVLMEAVRPMLASDLDGKRYLEQALSSGSRKKLRQHRRRLAGQSPLEYKIITAPAEVERSLEDFLTLEATGWKGRQGTALASDAADAAYTRAMIAALAARGEASIHALTLDDKPVSMQIVLRAGSAAFTWKTAYDETWADFSPGMLLLEDYTTSFLADAGIAHVDSCAYDETSFMGAWRERQAIATLWLDATPGGSPAFTILSGLQRAYLRTRATAKAIYLAYVKKRVR
jgi:CelD/BcsL family acetyltransferase involved in cellulose biosynthesis